jgi:hypothetical protein
MNDLTDNDLSLGVGRRRSAPGLVGSAWLLSVAGAIPFVSAASASWLVPEHAVTAWMTQAAFIYGAIILSFLGGIHWGRALAGEDSRPLWFAVTPALLGWGAVLLEPRFGVPLLGVGFIAQFLVDLFLDLPPWFRLLRLAITLVVIACLAQLGLHAWF